MQLHRNLHQPLQVKRLLIMDVTLNQPFTTNPKNMPAEIETLLSYNDGMTG